MIPYIEIIDKNTLKKVTNIEPNQCWFELSYYDVGQFEIYARATAKNSNFLKKGHFVKIPNKRYVWVITSIKKEFVAGSGKMIIAKGYEAKWLLKKGAIETPLQLPTTLSSAVVKLIDNFLIKYINNFGFELINIDIPLNETQAPRGNLLEFVNKLLKTYNCGSQVIYESGQLKYKILQGQDLSIKIKFSQSLDNLLSSEYFSNDENVATCALVVCKVNDIEYTEEYDTGKTGIDRAAIVVNSNLSTKYEDASGQEKELDLTKETDLALFKTWLREEGKNELANHVTIEEFNGEIDLTNSKYSFENDFNLGDQVAIRDEELDFYFKTRILKYTFKQDKKYNEEADYGGQ